MASSIIQSVNLGEVMKGLKDGIREYKNYPQRRYDYSPQHNYSSPVYGRINSQYSPNQPPSYRKTDLYNQRK